MSQSRLMVEIAILWQRFSPNTTFMKFILKFSDWCAINWGIDSKELNNEQLLFLLQEYCEHLERLRREYNA